MVCELQLDKVVKKTEKGERSERHTGIGRDWQERGHWEGVTGSRRGVAKARRGGSALLGTPTLLCVGVLGKPSV